MVGAATENALPDSPDTHRRDLDNARLHFLPVDIGSAHLPLDTLAEVDSLRSGDARSRATTNMSGSSGGRTAILAQTLRSQLVSCFFSSTPTVNASSLSDDSKSHQRSRDERRRRVSGGNKASRRLSYDAHLPIKRGMRKRRAYSDARDKAPHNREALADHRSQQAVRDESGPPLLPPTATLTPQSEVESYLGAFAIPEMLETRSTHQAQDFGEFSESNRQQRQRSLDPLVPAESGSSADKGKGVARKDDYTKRSGRRSGGFRDVAQAALPRMGEAGSSAWAARTRTPTTGHSSRSSHTRHSIQSLVSGPGQPRFSRLSQDGERPSAFNFFGSLHRRKSTGGSSPQIAALPTADVPSTATTESHSFVMVDADGEQNPPPPAEVPNRRAKKAPAAPQVPIDSQTIGLQFDPIAVLDPQQLPHASTSRVARHAWAALGLLGVVLYPGLFYVFVAPYVYETLSPAVVFVSVYLVLSTWSSYLATAFVKPATVPLGQHPHPQASDLSEKAGKSRGVNRGTELRRGVGASDDEDPAIAALDNDSPRRKLALAKLREQLRRAIATPEPGGLGGDIEAGLGSNAAYEVKARKQSAPQAADSPGGATRLRAHSAGETVNSSPMLDSVGYNAGPGPPPTTPELASGALGSAPLSLRPTNQSQTRSRGTSPLSLQSRSWGLTEQEGRPVQPITSQLLVTSPTTYSPVLFPPPSQTEAPGRPSATSVDQESREAWMQRRRAQMGELDDDEPKHNRSLEIVRQRIPSAKLKGSLQSLRGQLLRRSVVAKVNAGGTDGAANVASDALPEEAGPRDGGSPPASTSNACSPAEAPTRRVPIANSPDIDAADVEGSIAAQIRWCPTCKSFPPLRAFHSPYSDRCVLDFQFHSAWLGCDIGRSNLLPYVVFLAFACLSVAYMVAFSAWALADLSRWQSLPSSQAQARSNLADASAHRLHWDVPMGSELGPLASLSAPTASHGHAHTLGVESLGKRPPGILLLPHARRIAHWTLVKALQANPFAAVLFVSGALLLALLLVPCQCIQLRLAMANETLLQRETREKLRKTHAANTQPAISNTLLRRRRRSPHVPNPLDTGSAWKNLSRALFAGPPKSRSPFSCWRPSQPAPPAVAAAAPQAEKSTSGNEIEQVDRGTRFTMVYPALPEPVTIQPAADGQAEQGGELQSPVASPQPEHPERAA